MLAVFADPLDPLLSEMLNDSELEWKSVITVSALRQWNELFSGVLVSAENDPEEALSICRNLQIEELKLGPILLVCPPKWLDLFATHSGLFDEIILTSASGNELRARFTFAQNRLTNKATESVIEYDEVSVNVTNYQASVCGRPLDMTYMEYKLLEYFVRNPERVLTREQLLRDVWGYEYFGGGRTVDVHVRRLRAKFGEERAHLIQTVRSLGYLFSRSR